MRKQLTDEERNAKREKELEFVQKAVEELRSSDGWINWLKSRSRFHKYSLGNTLLISAQSQWMKDEGWVDTTPTRVASFRGWLKLGYCVRKRPESVPEGSWGLKIWAPIPPSKKRLAEAQETGEKLRTFFRLTSVFGNNQVEVLSEFENPVPLAPPSEPTEGDSLAHCWGPLVKLVESYGGTVAKEDTDNAGGYLRPSTKHIGISEKSSINGAVSTLIHEVSHLLVREDKQEGDVTLDYASEELVVESVALTVTGMLGLDISGRSVPYLTGWSSGDTPIETIEATASLINRLANKIESVLEDVGQGHSETQSESAL